jgi:SOS-response transcriptional repressor LexA
MTPAAMKESPQAAFGQRLLLARTNAGFLSARQAALQNNWSLRSYAFHEQGRSFPAKPTLAAYAAAFDVTIDWLLTGNEDVTINQLNTSAYGEMKKSVPSAPFRRIPLLSGNELMQLPIDKRRVMTAAKNTYVAPEPLGVDAFVYQIPPDDLSMVNNAGGPLSFQPSACLTIDPNSEILPGHYVLALIGDDVVVRRYEGARKYAPGQAFDLVPLNSVYRKTEIKEGDSCYIYGRIVGIYIPV